MNEKKNFKHDSCVIIGGGYSVIEGIKKGLWDKIKEKSTIISTNYCYQFMPYLPEIQIFCDQHFWNNEKGEMQKLYEKGVHIAHRHIGQSRYIQGTEKFNVSRENYYGKNGIEKNSLFYGEYGFVGVFALSYAICYFSTIYLLGYCHQYDPETGLTHWYQNLGKTSSYGVGNKIVYQEKSGKANKSLKDYKKFLDKLDSFIYNIGDSAIPYFNKISYDEFFEMLERQ